MSQDVAPPEPNPVAESEPSMEELEQRLQRLEDAVAALCDLQGMEDRLFERLVERFKKKTQMASASPTSLAIPAVPEQQAGKDPPKQPRAWGLADQMETMTALGEMWQELRLTWGMLRDPLYPIPWVTRLVVLIPVIYIVWTTLAGFHNGILGIFGFIIDVVLLIPLLYVSFKVWQRELRRYRNHRATYGPTVRP